MPAAGIVAHYTGVPAAGTRYYWDPVPVTGTGDRTLDITLCSISFRCCFLFFCYF